MDELEAVARTGTAQLRALVIHVAVAATAALCWRPDPAVAAPWSGARPTAALSAAGPSQPRYGVWS
jgi:hypothetical protein